METPITSQATPDRPVGRLRHLYRLPRYLYRRLRNLYLWLHQRLGIWIESYKIVGTVVTLTALVLRFLRLHIPKKIIPLDEFYYAVNALGILRYGADYELKEGAVLPALDCAAVALKPVFSVHPPVGKWFIGIGMRIFGCNSFGWRVGAAVFGTLTVLLVFLIGRRLFRKAWVAGLAALLVAIDGLHFVQSRIAMLDIFLAFFLALTVWLLLEDRARTAIDHRGIRWWRFGSGVALGLGIATKWSAAFVLPILIVLAIVWEMERRRQATRAAVAEAFAELTRSEQEALTDAAQMQEAQTYGDLGTETEEQSLEAASAPEDELAPTPPWESMSQRDASVALGRPIPRVGSMLGQLGRISAVLLLLPVFVYLLSHLPWFAAGDARYKAPRCATQADIKFDGVINPVNSKIWNADFWPDSMQEWVCSQREIYNFHDKLLTVDKDGKPSHPYLSRAWTWPYMGRPTSHYFDTDTIGETKYQAEILGLPNPVLWFPAFFLALPLCVWWALRRRDQVAATLLLLFAPLFLPWLIETRPMFTFYMTPAVAILALMVAHLVDRSIGTFKPWQKIVMFMLMFAGPLTPLYMQWLHNGTTPQLLYKIPMLGAIALIAAGLSSLGVFSRKPRSLAAGFALWAVIVFAYFYPVLAAVHIPDEGSLGWRKHMWLQKDCIGDRIRLNCWI